MTDYLSILRQYWGYDSFRGIQQDIIESIGSGKDTLGLMPTGGGKSVTFQVPALAMDGMCLVITPLIALMKDQVRHLRVAKPHINGYNYSFSGLKTSFLYTLRDALKENPDFIKQNKADLAASLQRTIIDILMDKFGRAIKDTGIRTIAIGGGVSANSAMRAAVEDYARRHHLKAFIPKRVFTTDNAAMIAIAGHYKFLDGDFCDITAPPFQRVII